MNTEQVTESLKAIDGVEDATVTVALNGFPGNYRSTTRLTVTAEGDAALGEVLRQTASVIWAEYGTQLPQYRFAVEAPWPGGPQPLQLVVLRDRQAEFGFTQGKYLGTHLILTREELAAMFGAAE
ncbi:hypothetical protein E3T26_13930 [Cryobacterium sp. TMT1-21]|uniref:Uncharacterized protein n=1 Tax=Cryobacterium shii TaxID=1259235 RepID=A0AAQ2C4W4_9MICO|nr:MULTISPECIES: hypothetical protein [Cryobacterium]TFC43418.1 hypothetical protein E3O49_13230 [Cryobacterium shii]TFC89586.1 hypothetical protein E3T24_00760 [Cryobacterium sp. TmT2-59]TFD10460.1 hypothetical protein E3T26_13930 [Cryobacterium sp. TMT1-21]TFD14200.1 hypothetical protein E3T42_12040 [Cryobacterium sp. TMT4-10]TFD20218.1 hypothetical protein E3T32_09295 [Cryobacterium sp. TMT2-23]